MDAAVEALSDGDLLWRSRGEPECFAQLFDRYFAVLHGYAARRLGRAGGDDVAAETMLVAFSRRMTFDPAKGTVKAWLFGIATNLIHGQQRDEIRGYRAYARAAADLAEPGHEDLATARAAASTARNRILAALADLSTGDRDALLLVVWGEMSHEEAAAALQVPVGTIGSRMHRARRRLREALNHFQDADERPEQ
ncbi:RNA polymerase sigma factor [Actinoplanes couchii]|uniref:DNA-directed RNA polymerase sigma-70 factor n=1 Tax=Actinoplanes couchii TaxID=403638 RepID=A0ABQ3XTZ5_9ACTN|nr:RNA polymerase sigma factor [Actinoplanes couchii]MDR6317751.1 RNA polymerase sigma-70 factor (ECF subfamily) [Actinoplanes couchii]GID62001.1 DNA-directed RNA polymerase sigma-70 factor [Actinoplanes couchii]